MLSSYGLTAENMLHTLPAILQNDETMQALASAIAEQLELQAENVRKIAIFSEIDTMPETLLDILAHDFKVDWWNGDYTLTEKREVLANNWRVHRTLGTKYAVETAISAIYPDTQVAEWFEYDGEPFHFKLLINISFEGIDAEKHQRVLARVAYYKNLRSVLDEVEYYDAGGTANLCTAAACVGDMLTDCAQAVNYFQS